MSNARGAHRLRKIAEELGEPIEELIPRVVREEGAMYRAAQRLGVAPNTVRYWLKRLGYNTATTSQIELVKENTEVTHEPTL